MTSLWFDSYVLQLIGFFILLAIVYILASYNYQKRVFLWALSCAKLNLEDSEKDVFVFRGEIYNRSAFLSARQREFAAIVRRKVSHAFLIKKICITQSKITKLAGEKRYFKEIDLEIYQNLLKEFDGNRQRDSTWKAVNHWGTKGIAPWITFKLPVSYFWAILNLISGIMAMLAAMLGVYPTSLILVIAYPLSSWYRKYDVESRPLTFHLLRCGQILCIASLIVLVLRWIFWG